ncbi:MAG: thioredoxin family protein [Phycisphaerae bacterium]|nr:thioredoxin family protein [Phycisphaerae bacterium]
MNSTRWIVGAGIVGAVAVGLWQTDVSADCGASSCSAAKAAAAQSCPATACPAKAKACPTASSTGHAQVGKPAPNFTLPDAEGKRHSLSDHKGRIVVLEWTNQQCPYVVKHHTKERTTQDLNAKYAGKDVDWVAIDSTHSRKPEEVKTWSAKHRIDYPTLLDQSGKVGRAYGAKTTPHVFVINKDGILVYSGAIDDQKGHNYVAAALDDLLAGKPVARSETKPYGCGVKYSRQVAKAGNGGNGGNGGQAKECADKKDCCGSASCPPQGCGAQTAKAGGNGGNGGDAAKAKKSSGCGTCQ